jgi:biopolymer transport protein ExbD
MRIRPLHHTPTAAKINVTPLIDVVMVLIIFYLIVGKLAADRQTRVDLPGSATGAGPEADKPVIVTIAMSQPGQDPTVLVDGNEVPQDGLVNVLRARLAGESGQPIVQVRADRKLPYGSVAPVVRACREAGLTSLRLVTERIGGGP